MEIIENHGKSLNLVKSIESQFSNDSDNADLKKQFQQAKQMLSVSLQKQKYIMGGLVEGIGSRSSD